MLNLVEDEMLVWHEGQNKWYRLHGRYRTYKIAASTDHEKRAHDRKGKDLICRSIDTGKCVFMADESIRHGDMFLACMAQVVDGAEDEGPEPTISLHRERTVIVSPITSDGSHMLDDSEPGEKSSFASSYNEADGLGPRRQGRREGEAERGRSDNEGIPDTRL